ncbi:MAG: DbpA RNA binding domain-containing protein [Spirochaetaceae bacterium]|jgi:hypothetical protein|nr:DbpA RNA binding domain-containing protein [Spirochaetaceae bacterium]
MNEEALRKRIHTLLEGIHTGVDPVLLNRYRSIFRQEVSFFNRSYLAAYLLLLAEEGPDAQFRSASPGGGPRGKNDYSPERHTRKAAGKNNEAPRHLGEEESVRLFVGIGRSRKVFPREILALIAAKTQIPREDIGTIRILDNYSFIQVRTTQAEAVIRALNGQLFRGRTLTVNYARSRREGEDEADMAESPGESGNSGEP